MSESALNYYEVVAELRRVGAALQAIDGGIYAEWDDDVPVLADGAGRATLRAAGPQFVRDGMIALARLEPWSWSECVAAMQEAEVAEKLGPEIMARLRPIIDGREPMDDVLEITQDDLRQAIAEGAS